MPDWKKRVVEEKVESSRVVASTSGMVTEIGFPKMDAMFGQGISAGHVGAPMLYDAALGFELPPREKLVSGEKFSKRSKFYPSQSAQTLLKDVSTLIPRQ